MKQIKLPVSSLPAGVPGLVRWIKGSAPNLYSSLQRRFGVMRMAGLGLTAPDAGAVPAVDVVKQADSGGPGVANMIVSTIKDLVSTALPLYQQQQLFNLQIKRAQSGLAPLNVSNLQDASAFRVGVDSSTRNTGLVVAGVLVAGAIGYALIRRK